MIATLSVSPNPTPTNSCPPTPPNTEAGARSRANSLLSNVSRTTSEPVNGPLTPARVSTGDAPRRLPRNMGVTRFADVLENIVEEQPGRFYEAPTGVPENTPCASIVDGPTTPRSQISPTTIYLSHIDERLEGLPAPATPAASSIFGGSTTDNQSSISEPLLIATRRSRLLTGPNSPLPRSVIEAERPGVREHTDWAKEVEEEVVHNLVRLANLAVDDNQTNPELTTEEHYHERLTRLINNPALSFIHPTQNPMSSTGQRVSSQPAMGEPTTREAATGEAVSPERANDAEAQALRYRIGTVQHRVNVLVDMHGQSVHNVGKLEKQFKKKIEESDGRVDKLEKENETLRRDMEEIKKAMQTPKDGAKAGEQVNLENEANKGVEKGTEKKDELDA